jgi:hypothetical protein
VRLAVITDGGVEMHVMDGIDSYDLEDYEEQQDILFALADAIDKAARLEEERAGVFPPPGPVRVSR